MPRHEPSRREEPLLGAGGKVKMRRGADGRMHVVLPERETTETTEAAERPSTADDPRTSSQRDVPPYGAGI
jgi:hypothetical protein